MRPTIKIHMLNNFWNWLMDRKFEKIDGKQLTIKFFWSLTSYKCTQKTKSFHKILSENNARSSLTRDFFVSLIPSHALGQVHG